MIARCKFIIAFGLIIFTVLLHAQFVGQPGIGAAASSPNSAPSGGGGGGDTTFITGQTLGTLRNDFTGNVGFIGTVGASAMTITQLGRWVVSGNSHTHTLYLKTSAGVTLQSVVVNTSGAGAGAFLYGSITPTVVASGDSYMIESAETSGQDQWYDQDTTLTHTADGTIDDVVSADGFGDGNPDHTYVPVSFKYHL